MPDNVSFQGTTVSYPPTDLVVSTDKSTDGLRDVQRVKLAYSADGSETHVPADVDGLLVNLGANNDVTVSGVATAANQTTIIGHLDGVEGVLATIDADTGTLAGAVAGSEVQVDVVAALPAGTNAIGKLAANSGVDIGDVDITSLPSTVHSADFDSSAGTDTTLAFGIAVPASGGAAVVPGDATAGLKVDLGADNDVVVTGTVTANLAAGANNIGDVDVLTMPAPLSTSGGGTEATALRVTLATDSTGVLSVDDNGGSLTVDAPVGTPAFVRLSDGAAAITTLPVSVASVPSHAVTNAGTFAVQAAQSGTWTVQPGNTANTTAWKVDGSAVTQPVSAASLPLPTGASTSALQGGGLPVALGAGGGLKIDGSGTAIPVTASAGTNLNTSALALEAGGNLAAAATSLATLDNAISGSEMQVDVVGSLPAGTAAIGRVGHDQTGIGDGRTVTPSTVTLATSAAADDIIDTSGSHGYSAGDEVRFPSLTGGAGLVAGTHYFVSATSLAATTFRVSAALVPDTPLGFTTDITAGTVVKVRVPLASTTAAKTVLIVAETDNTGTLVVGAAATVVAALATRRGAPLSASESLSLPIDNLADVGLDSTVAGDGVTFVYTT